MSPQPQENPPEPTAETPPESWLSVDDLAKRWGMSRTFVRRLIWSGGIPASKIGKAIRVRPQDLDAYETAARIEGER